MNSNYLEDLSFDEKFIQLSLSKIDYKLTLYIQNEICPQYQQNDNGHNIDHINYVLKRAIEISRNYDIDYNILYTCVMFHDLACHIDRENHEVLSANLAFEDVFLNNFFNYQHLLTIKEAIEDHRASINYIPRNIYGKILSSADRKVEVKRYLYASISFNLSKKQSISKEDIINNSYNFAIKKFGKNGYAINKIYVEDEKYQKFLNDIQYLIDNKELFDNLASIIYDNIICNKKMYKIKKSL